MEFREAILRTCFESYEGEFAAGATANNKLDIEKLSQNSELEDKVISALCRNVLEHNPEFVTGVPRGGTDLAVAVAKRIYRASRDIYPVYLKKGEGTVDFEDWVDKEAICKPLSRGVLIEDVLNTGSSTKQALAIPELGERIVAVEAVWDRGEGVRSLLGVPGRALVSEPIPAILPDDSELWEFAPGG